MDEKRFSERFVASFGSDKIITLDDIFRYMEENNISQIQCILGHYVVFHKKGVC